MSELTGPGLSHDEAHAETPSQPYRRVQATIVAEYQGDKTLHGLSGNLIRANACVRRLKKVEAGALDEVGAAAERLIAYKARMAALERLVGREGLETEFLKRGMRSGPSRRARLLP